MKKVILLVALFVSPVFAQEEEIQIELESGGSPAVDSVLTENRNSVRTMQLAAMPDGSVWHFVVGGSSINRIVHCNVDEDGNPSCEEVDIDD